MNNVDKYPVAIVEYELSRKLIQDLTKKMSWADCANLENDKTCLKRYWEANIHNQYVRDEGMGDIVNVTLCPCCTETDRLVQERKIAKQQFGRAKTKLSLLGQQLIKKGLG